MNRPFLRLPNPRPLLELTLLTLTLLLVFTSLAPAASPTPAAPPNTKPNLLLIVTDDIGYNDFGFQGSKDIKTPHLDALARQSIRFTNAYVTAPICGASRCGLLTGRYQQRHSFEDTPLGNVGMSVNEKTLADGFKPGGYVTGLVGKWSVGSAEQYWPLTRGFDEFFGFLGMLHPYLPGPVPQDLAMLMSESPRPGWNSTPNAPARAGLASPAAQPAGRANPPLARPTLINSPGNFIGNTPGKFIRGNVEVDEPQYATEAFAREAISFIRRHRDQPFFLDLSFNASHSPLQPTQKYLDRFPTLQGKRQLYAATTSALDDAVEDVLAALRDNGLEEKTLIIFINDNGGAVDDIAADNSPLSGSKFQLWEGGIRVPMFARWKGHFPEGKTIDQPVISLDIFPTFLAAAGLPPPPGKQLDGINLLPLLTAGTSDPAQMQRPLFWRSNNLFAVRQGKWKLVLPQPGVPAPCFSTSPPTSPKITTSPPKIPKSSPPSPPSGPSGTTKTSPSPSPPAAAQVPRAPAGSAPRGQPAAPPNPPAPAVQ